MAATMGTRAPRINPVMREGERVTPLELFFDLVFVLAITQCTALMAADPTWTGVAQGLLVLGVLWWSWAGYAWLTSVIDPEEGAVRLAFFAAMAALLVVALCVPKAFDNLALTFALAYGAVRAAHIGLFVIASRDEPGLRRSTTGLAISTAVAIGLLVAASLFDGAAQGALWALALTLDLGGPYFFGTEGWKLVPGHFAERHGLIMIIALGESIVAIGVGAEVGLDAGVVAAAVVGVALVCAMWWVYFDVVALVSARRLARAAEGRERNALARDSYSYLHLPMVAGIVLVALGLKKTLADVGDPLETVPAFALLGGVGVYLLAHVALRLRNVHTVNRQRLVLGVALFALVPIAVEIPALASVAAVTAMLSAMIAYETLSYGDARDRVRHELAAEPHSSQARASG
jgi:low temperature requirement protein LtrA